MLRFQRIIDSYCRSNDLIPRYIQDLHGNLKHLKFYSNRGNKLFNSCKKILQKKLLRLQIKDIHLKFLKNKQKLIEKILLKNLDNNLVSSLKSFYQNYLDNLNEKLIFNSNKKINALINKSNVEQPSNINNFDQNNNNKNWFLNLTNIEIPTRVIDTVSMGQKFSVRSCLTNVDAIQAIKNVEYLIDKNQFDNEVIDDMRYSIISCINQHLNKTKHINAIDRKFYTDVCFTKKFLKSQSNIFFTNADKGNSTVACCKDYYYEQMEALLKDISTYKKLDKDPLEGLQKRTYHFLSRWNINGFLTKKFHKFSLTQTNTCLARLYGLPKVHKVIFDNNGRMVCKFRPVVSTVGTPTHFLAKQISTILNNCIKKPDSYIKNSSYFIEKIKNISIPDDHVFVSFDATSLFTNVPPELVKSGIERRYEQMRKHTIIPLDEFFKAVDFLNDNTFLQFNKKYYKQVFGTPMGSAVSSVFSDIVMSDLETQCLNSIDFKPLFYFRYVDDIITCIPKNKIMVMLNNFNSYHPKLQFTHEVEQENTINFLDIQLIKDENKILHNWYRKPISSLRYVNFRSGHTEQQKIGIIYCLVDKAILLSNDIFHEKNLNILR